MEPSQAARPAHRHEGIDPVVSERIAIVRFPLIIGVILTHSFWGRQQGFTLPCWLEFAGNIVYDVLPRCAVPLFTFISGYLYYSGYGGRFEDYLRKNRIRLRTLLVPLLIWNTMVVCVYIFRTELLGVNRFFTGSWSIPVDGAWEIADRILGITDAPVVGPFWFVRNLIIMCMISPVIYGVLHVPRLGVFSWITVTLMWLAGLIGDGCNLGIMATIFYSLVFFSAGALCSMRKVDLTILDRYWAYLLAVWLVLASAAALTPILQGREFLSDAILVRCARLIGCVAAWTLFSRLQRITAAAGTLLAVSAFSFFTFAMHAPLINIIARVCYWLLGPLDVARYMVATLLIPVLIMAIAGVSAWLLHRYARPVFGVLSGSRS